MRTGITGTIRAMILVISFFFVSAGLFGADIYVRAGASGKGSMEEPYGELWKAMERAIRGDVIHVAEGVYTGKGGSGAFIAKVPSLTLAGGYSPDFSSRNPFSSMTILKRAEDYKGDNTGLPNGIVSGQGDHSNLTVDGFVIEGRTRNKYRNTGDISESGSFSGPLFETGSPNVRIRNCIILNPFGVGVYCKWQGEENEVVNTFVLNSFYTGISTRSAQENAVILIKNCTIGFTWNQTNKGGGTSVFIGSQGRTVLENNIFMFNQLYGVHNGFGNEDTVMKDNVFFQCQGGYYHFMDDDGKNLLAWKEEDLKDLNDEPEFYMLWEAGGNTAKAPGLKPDSDYFEKFTNFAAAEPGKLEMDEMNKWRQSLGLPLQAGPGKGKSNYGHAYPLAAVAPNLAAPGSRAGVNMGADFATYASEAAEGKSHDYKTKEFADFKRGTEGVKDMKGEPVSFRAGLGPDKQRWFETIAARSDYRCVMLLKPGEEDEYTRDFMLGYILKGSEAEKAWNKYYKKLKKYNAEGIVIKGVAHYLDDSYMYPVAIVVNEISAE